MKDVISVGVSWDGVRYKAVLEYGQGWGSWVEYPRPANVTRQLWSSDRPEVEIEWIERAVIGLVQQALVRATRAAQDRVDGDPVYFSRIPGQLELFDEK